MTENRAVKICEMLEFTSKAGNKYFRGFAGDAEYVLYGGEKELKSRPGEPVPMWRLLVEERFPARRPKSPPAADAARGEQTDRALRERAEQWNSQARDKHVQELADRFQPDTEIPF